MKTRIAVAGLMITGTPDKVPLSPLAAAGSSARAARRGRAHCPVSPEPVDTHLPAPAELPGREPVELRRIGL
ncbi:hypothetical protein GCM10010234_61760 [Streptomyces hawaiiensis]|uniref:hypothetical protein n=1 Tax=Streptomyces hawaiiensis TaxID=67305 RepID=UPI0031E12E8F